MMARLMLKPKPRGKIKPPLRLPNRKRMTIALGVLCGDGLIIAADTEESDGFLKTSQPKISVATNIHVYSSVGKKPRMGRGSEEIAYLN